MGYMAQAAGPPQRVKSNTHGLNYSMQRANDKN
jgi:hypothetical protein